MVLKKLWLIFWFLVFAPGVALCQTTPAKTPNTETKAVKSDTVKVKPEQPRMVTGLRKYARRKGPLPWLVRQLLSSRSAVEEFDNRSLVDNTYGIHDYKIVRQLQIKNLEPFGYSVNDTTRLPDNWLEKAGNAVHFKTHRGRIRNTMLLQVNEMLEPEALQESERLLRQTPYLLDARLIASPTHHDDSVDIVAITRDIWSLTGSGSYSPSSKSGGASLRDVNFLGFGHTLRTEYDFGIGQPQTWAFEGSYLIPNFSRSFINTEIHYTNRYPTKRFGLSITRDFYTFTTRVAGGGYVDWFDEKVKVGLNGPVHQVQYTIQDGWVARAFRLRSRDLWEENRTRLVIGGRIRKVTYNKRPYTERFTFHNSKLYLLSSGLSLRKYFRDRYIFGFGRTEDIATGRLLLLTGGYENGEFEKRLYSGLKITGAKYSRTFGYLYGGAEFGSFYDGDQWEQGVVSLEALYFSKLIQMGEWKLRPFVLNRLSYGINRRPGESINISDENGLRGFNFSAPIGTKRYVVNLEANLFTPFALLGFRMAGVAFADFSWIAPEKQKLFNSKIYQGYGIGLRFRNEYLVFNTIQLMFAYYPVVPDSDGVTRLLNTSRTYYDFKDFNFAQPFTSPF